MFENLIIKAYNLLDKPKKGIGKQKHFSFILKRNKLICVGWNDTWKTTPLAKRYGYRFNCTHSELAAIRNFPKPNRFLTECRMVNIRIRKDGSLGMAKPCPICQSLLKDFGIKEVWYSSATEFRKL